MMKDTKQKTPRQEVAAQKRAEMLPKVKKAVYKFSAGVVLIVAAYSSFYNLIHDHVTNVPKILTDIISAVITISLVVVLAHCDS